MKLNIIGLLCLAATGLTALTAAPGQADQKPVPQIPNDVILRKPSERSLTGGWPVGSTLHVYFMNGNAAKRRQFAECTSEWSKYGNFLIQYHQEPMPRGVYAILVQFMGAGGGMSHLGFGTYDNETPSIRLDDKPGSCTVFAHEFGHTLGLSHEFENPAGLKHIEVTEETYKILESAFGWSRAEADAKLLKKVVPPGKEKPFDPVSVMGYTSNLFPGLYKGVSMQPSNGLSEGDKAYIARMYPGKTSQTILPFTFTDDHLAPVEAVKALVWPAQKLSMSVPASFQIHTSNASRFAFNNPSFSSQGYLVPGFVEGAERAAFGSSVKAAFLNGMPLTNVQTGWSGSSSDSQKGHWEFSDFSADGADSKGQPTKYVIRIVAFKSNEGWAFSGYFVFKRDDVLEGQVRELMSSLAKGAAPSPAPPVTPAIVTPSSETVPGDPCPYAAMGWCKDVKDGTVEHRGAVYRVPAGIARVIALPDTGGIGFDFEAPEESWRQFSERFQKFYTGTVINGGTVGPFVMHKDGYLVSRSCDRNKRGVEITIFGNGAAGWYGLKVSPCE